MPKNAYFEQEQTAKEYEAYYDTKYKRADQLEKKLLTTIFNQFPLTKSVVEVGCGTGHFTRWMESDLSLDCIGIDKSKAMLKEAKKRWAQGALLQADGTKLPFRNKSVDIVVFITSLEFIQDAVAAIKEAANAAKKGIILGLMNKNSPSTLRKRLTAKTLKGSFYNQAKFYSYSDIQKILENTIPEEYNITFWSTTIFPKLLEASTESSVFSFGAFLGIAVKLRDKNE